MSLGVAMVDLASPLEESAKRADAALYAAKHAGRNRVVQCRPGADAPFVPEPLALHEGGKEVKAA
jgi:hypothetical protein